MAEGKKINFCGNRTVRIPKTNIKRRRVLYEHIPRLRCIKACAKEWNQHRCKGERFIHPDEIREFLKNDDTVFKYKFGNRWIINYDQLEPHLRKISKTKRPYCFDLFRIITKNKSRKKK